VTCSCSLTILKKSTAPGVHSLPVSSAFGSPFKSAWAAHKARSRYLPVTPWRGPDSGALFLFTSSILSRLCAKLPNCQ